MDKQAFVNELKAALEDEVRGSVINENMAYYRQYIDDEIAKGRPESEVMDELGDPRLIAKTIIEAESVSHPEGSGHRGYSDITEDDLEDAGWFGKKHKKRQGPNIRFYDLNKWYVKLIGVLLVVAVMTLLILLFQGLFYLLFRFAGPIFLIFLLVWFVRNMRR